MIPWWALVVLVLSHVALFAAGVASFQLMRWVNARPIYAKPVMTEQKAQQIADRAMQQAAAQATRYAYFDGPVSPVKAGRVEGEESFAPSAKK